MSEEDQGERGGAERGGERNPSTRVDVKRSLTPNPHVELVGRGENSRHVIAGTSVPVHRLWKWHRRGVSVDVLFRRYPSLTRAQILDALSWAHDHLSLVEGDAAAERRLIAP